MRKNFSELTEIFIELEMDSLDRRILRELQRDCSLSAAALADRCGTTESTALRRRHRLRRDGVIRAEVAEVAPAKVGRGLFVFLRVRLERETGPKLKAFVDRIRDHPAVLHFYFVTGTTDYVILLNLGSMEEYDSFLQSEILTDPMTVMSDTNVVIRPIKMSTVIPIDEP